MGSPRRRDLGNSLACLRKEICQRWLIRDWDFQMRSADPDVVWQLEGANDLFAGHYDKLVTELLTDLGCPLRFCRL